MPDMTYIITVASELREIKCLLILSEMNRLGVLDDNTYCEYLIKISNEIAEGDKNGWPDQGSSL